MPETTFTGWAKAYLDLLRQDPSLCLPHLLLGFIAEQLGIEESRLRQRRAARRDVREEEKRIIGGHLGRLRAQEAQRAGEAPSVAEDEDLPPVLERYLEVYGGLERRGEKGGRLGAVRQLQAEGVPIELEDILEAMVEVPAFATAMQRIWREGNIEAEDGLRTDARKGDKAARALYLRGNMPEKYGNKVKVDVDVRHLLDDGDRQLVEEVGKAIRPYRPSPSRVVPAPDLSLSDADVVDGELVS